MNVAKAGVVVNASFNVSKALRHSAEKFHIMDFRVSQVSRTTMLEYQRINLW